LGLGLKHPKREVFYLGAHTSSTRRLVPTWMVLAGTDAFHTQ
jgi:hypothetical protein